MRLSPVLTGLRTYPFVRLAEARRRLLDAGVDVIDFGLGEPREDTPAFIREALVARRSTRSRATRRPRGCRSCARRSRRGSGAASACRWTRDTEVVPTFGSKEAIFLLAQVLDGDRRGRAAAGVPGLRARRRVRRQGGRRAAAARGRDGFLPDLDAVPADVWRRTAILWLNYPNNPTAATAPLELYERAAALAREHDFVLASDEAYSELYFGADAAGLGAAGRRPHERRGLQHALQALLDARLPLRLRGRRPGARRRPQALPPQRRRRAAGVRPARRRGRVGRRGARRGRCATLYRAKRDVLLPALEARGLRHAGGDATFFLWLEGAPDGLPGARCSSAA